MKKSIVLGILGLAAAAVTSYGQGYITLDNYSSGTDPMVTYGLGVPLNGVSGALGGLGTGLNGSWTIGLYWVGGTTGLSQAAGTGLPDASLGLGTGGGSAIEVAGPNAGGLLGYYSSIPNFNSGSTLNTTLTLEIVAYPTAAGSYAAALYRAHSAAFSMGTVSATSPTPSLSGDFMPGTLTVAPVPEPTTMALAGLGGLSLLLMRRKQS